MKTKRIVILIVIILIIIANLIFFILNDNIINLKNFTFHANKFETISPILTATPNSSANQIELSWHMNGLELREKSLL